MTENRLDRKPTGRRDFARRLGAGSLAIAAAPLVGQTRPRVVIIGGGAGGASVARELAANAADGLDVTLIEKSARYVSCFHSNLYLGGLRSLQSLTHDYRRIGRDSRIRLVTAHVDSIERDAQQVRLAGGERIDYDRLVVCPGIDIIHDSIPGYSAMAAAKAPHAWQGGAQLALLQERFEALKNGDRVIIVAPPDPYRCPPGPYERASMMANRFLQKGFDKCRITLIDSKNSFAKQNLFDEAWQRYYPDTIEWLPADLHGGITDVDVDAGTVSTDFDAFSGDLLNIIPAQRAGPIAGRAELTDASGFCPVSGESMRSTLDERIFVVGDASIAGAMPKSAFAAHSQARVAAAALIADLLGRPASKARYANTCWSQLAENDAVRVGATYAADEAGQIVAETSFISAPGENAERRQATVRQSDAWYAAITTDMFGG